ncbi:DMT family transporter [Streptomyces sp. NPDC093546]|uniref:DMT family transporter n=1 Tax=Streptomyces sp. NPDC093546 TaxID=3366040 RepID=UPI0038178421
MSTSKAAAPHDTTPLPHPPKADRPTRAWMADLGVLGVAIVWGSTYVAMQWTGQYISVPAFLFLRFALGALAITALSLHLWRHVTRDELLLGCLFGVLLFAILFLETLGVRYTLASNAGFLIALSVMLVPLAERLFLRVRIARTIYPLTLLSVAGCALLTLHQGLSIRSGDLIILAAALIRAGQIVLFSARTQGRDLSLLRVTAIELWVVAAGGLLVALLQPGRSWAQITQLPTSAWLVIAYLGIAGTAFAFLVQLHAARASSPTRVGLVLSTEPFFAAVFAVILLGEHLGPLQILGGGLILLSAIAGRWVDARHRNGSPTTKPPETPQ